MLLLTMLGAFGNCAKGIRQCDNFLPIQESPLKVPKREIFDRSDFSDFYTIKSLRVGDFGVKIKN
jgi:hypothetical protein